VATYNFDLCAANSDINMRRDKDDSEKKSKKTNCRVYFGGRNIITLSKKTILNIADNISKKNVSSYFQVPCYEFRKS
jgi:hypothetical protein